MFSSTVSVAKDDDVSVMHVDVSPLSRLGSVAIAGGDFAAAMDGALAWPELEPPLPPPPRLSAGSTAWFSLVAASDAARQLAEQEARPPVRGGGKSRKQLPPRKGPKAPSASALKLQDMPVKKKKAGGRQKDLAFEAAFEAAWAAYDGQQLREAFRRALYKAQPEVAARYAAQQAEYRARPEVAAHIAAQQAAHFAQPEVAAHTAAQKAVYQARPEVAAHRAAQQAAHRAQPEVAAHIAAQQAERRRR